jgi:hypothetical protein
MALCDQRETADSPASEPAATRGFAESSESVDCPTEADLVVREIDGARWVSMASDACRPFADDALVHGTLQLDENGCLWLGNSVLLILPPNAELEREEDGELRLTRDGSYVASVNSEVEVGGGAWTFERLPYPCEGGAGDRHILLAHFD